MENPPPLEAQPAPMKPRRFPIVLGAVLVILLVAAVGVYTWFALYGPCSRENVKTAATALFKQASAFEQAFQSIASTAPIGLIGPVTQMEQTLLDTRGVAVPACMQVAKNELATSMESEIRAFLAIMNQEPEKHVKDLMQDSRTHIENFANEIEAVNKCAPFCL